MHHYIAYLIKHFDNLIGFVIGNNIRLKFYLCLSLPKFIMMFLKVKMLTGNFTYQLLRKKSPNFWPVDISDRFNK